MAVKTKSGDPSSSRPALRSSVDALTEVQLQQLDEIMDALARHLQR